MARPTTRENSSSAQFRERVPADLKERIRGKIIHLELPAIVGQPAFSVAATAGEFLKFSLRTRDPSAISHRYAAAKAQVEKQYAAFRNGPVGLTHKQIVALSGEVYSLYVERFAENPGSSDQWAAFKAFNRAVSEGRLLIAPPATPDGVDTIAAAEQKFGPGLTAGIDALPRSSDLSGMERRFGWLVGWVLNKHGLLVDAETRTRLLLHVGSAATDAAWHLKRNAVGDYSPDPKADRFPKFEAPAEAVSIDVLFERWKAETKPAASTISTWKGRPLGSLKEHLGDRAGDIRLISPDDIIGWKDKIVARGLTVKSINGTYLGMAGAIFSYAVDNRLLPSNPALGVKAAGRAKAGTSKLPYETAEVRALLNLARNETRATRRWLPWLAACTGARIGELAQLWGNRVTMIDGIPVLRIAPAEDGGSLKNIGSERDVPIHPALIKEGFLEFVKAKGNGPLFYRRTSGAPGRRHASSSAANQLSSWIREQGFTDPRKAPNHALRHWFKSVAVEVDIKDSVADAIQGHKARGEAHRYRHFKLDVLAAAVAKIPIPEPDRE
ncbi:tyrosine-type recombinase/integrase [Hartmannibacter diazotrophicus]|nr:tyrosine-type recombinase/integrase [Hartmannibacter diazotrophicus]